MTRNPILEELYAARARLLADADGDVHKYLEGVRRRERESGRLVKPQSQGANGGISVADGTASKEESSSAAR